MNTKRTHPRLDSQTNSGRIGSHLRREVRARRHALERELAGYASPAERLDLDAALQRSDSPETEEIRDMVDRLRQRDSVWSHAGH